MLMRGSTSLRIDTVTKLIPLDRQTLVECADSQVRIERRAVQNGIVTKGVDEIPLIVADAAGKVHHLGKPKDKKWNGANLHEMTSDDLAGNLSITGCIVLQCAQFPFFFLLDVYKRGKPGDPLVGTTAGAGATRGTMARAAGLCAPLPLPEDGATLFCHFTEDTVN